MRSSGAATKMRAVTYRVTYRDGGWVSAANGAPEWRQVVIVDLDDGAQLVVVVVRGALGGTPRVAEARIERAYITRTAGWKRRTVQRLRSHEVVLVPEMSAYAVQFATLFCRIQCAHRDLMTVITMRHYDQVSH
jgi:hypothetical protein